jgi:phosphorylcholine metabolism protein LicD
MRLKKTLMNWYKYLTIKKRCPSDAREEADKVLEEWDAVCKSLGIECFILHGTCLGLVRDHGYIKGDDDLDVGVKCTVDEKIKLKLELKKHGFFVSEEHATNLHFHRDCITLDIWFSFGRHEKFLSTYDTVHYNGGIYNVPHPVEGYLEERYGQDWRIPKKYRFKWFDKFRKDPYNMKVTKR